jgi:hypothetical protein
MSSQEKQQQGPPAVTRPRSPPCPASAAPSMVPTEDSGLGYGDNILLRLEVLEDTAPIPDHTWRQVGLLTAMIAQASGVHCVFEVTHAFVTLADARFPGQSTLCFRRGDERGIPPQQLSIEVQGFPASAIDAAKRFLLVVGVIALPTSRYWVEDSCAAPMALARVRRRRDVCQPWAVVWKSAAHWLAMAVPTVLMPQGYVPPPDAGFRLSRQ